MSAERVGQTIVRNISGQNGKYFAFLGEHGATLDNGHDVAIRGNLFDRWKNDARMTKAIKYALQNGLIEILQSPAVFICDTVTHAVHLLSAASAAVTTIDPDYGSYSGAAPNPPNDP